MSDLSRVTISLEDPLLQAFDRHIEAKGYVNRSEAIRDLIREKLIQEQSTSAAGVLVGVVMIVFDHHARELASRLIDKQHHHHDLVVSTLHVHLGERHCLEVTILRGQAKKVKHLADEMLAMRGVLHGHITYTSDDQAFTDWSAAEHGHSHGH